MSASDSDHSQHNSYSSYEKAVSLGATFYECDLQMTCDGHVIMYHDSKIGDGLIKDMTLEAVKTIFKTVYPDNTLQLFDAFINAAAKHNSQLGVYWEIKYYEDRDERKKELVKKVLV